jgi:hypothetical protein
MKCGAQGISWVRQPLQGLNKNIGVANGTISDAHCASGVVYRVIPSGFGIWATFAASEC